ncbi:YabP family protein [[Ruminococcus] torques]|uniref:YabP family protein n=1 Tax=[Ruminococcus] torques TaxID=33039 RepID=A0A564SN14_9FIRM|nr:sporulation protein YqfC [[Ruminococcus] torques]VUW95840.1 YabP family protein [[Ruminococcus] torques]
MNREQIKEKMVSAMDLPKDVIQNASLITILGRNELCIENYRGIIEYTDALIRVQTRTGQIRIQGKRLRIQYYTNDEMKVTGALSSLEFTEGRNPE